VAAPFYPEMTKDNIWLWASIPIKDWKKTTIQGYFSTTRL
jgi:hypothetical protein